MSQDARLYAPAVARNREPILEVLRRCLPSRGLVLEVASGSGEHVTHFAKASPPDLIFQPSDPDPGACASIDAWATTLDLRNVLPAIALDAASDVWPIARADAVLCINMIHIAPWAATAGLMRGAASVLPLGGMLYLYGPFRRDGRHTAPSNAAFDRDLRMKNPAWGVRDLEGVTARRCQPTTFHSSSSGGRSATLKGPHPGHSPNVRLWPFSELLNGADIDR